MSFEAIAKLYEEERMEDALALLRGLHCDWHDRPREHVLIHAWQARIALRRQRYQRAAWEWFAMVFAAPVSLVQKHAGLVRKNI